LLARLNTPEGLLECADEEIERHQRRWRELAREQGLAEKAFAEFTFAHPDSAGQRQALDARREHLDLALDKWKIEAEWFESVAPALEDALLKLADWHQRRTVLNRERGIVTECGVFFENPPVGPLTREAVERVFAFQRAFAGRGSEAVFERLLALAREHHNWPTRPAVTWR
jgi:hypothetical protein